MPHEHISLELHKRKQSHTETYASLRLVSTDRYPIFIKPVKNIEFPFDETKPTVDDKRHLKFLRLYNLHLYQTSSISCKAQHTVPIISTNALQQLLISKQDLNNI